MHIYMARHAERVIGSIEHYDLGLTERGQLQAALLATWLKDEVGSVDLLLSSTMPRAIETAKTISNKLNLSVVVEQRLREVGSCHVDGSSMSDNAPPPFGFAPRARPMEPVRPFGESWCQFRLRVEGFLNHLVDELGSSGRRIVIVCHSGVINAVHETIVHAEPFGPVETAIVNTGVTHWEYRPTDGAAERWRLHGHNIAYHLTKGAGPSHELISGAPLPY